MQSKFPVPNSLQDLERGPFTLLPYPLGFNDIDEATRAESFEDLLTVLENGNNVLKNGGMLLFDDEDANEGFAEWNDIERIQALYTLVRKSSSLAPSTRMKLVTTIVTSLKSLSSILLQSYAIDKQSGTVRDNSAVNANSGKVVSQSFRDAFACHIYMLYSVMFIIESDLKAGKNVSAATVSKGKSGKKKGESTRKGKENSNDSENIASMRDHCMETMHIVTQSMTKCSPILWSRAVPDESVIGLPSRIAYLILETAITSQSRKSSFTSHALNIIAISLDSDDRLFGTGIAVLFDFLHSYEHAASLVADLCCLVKETPVNKLALELLREIGRIDNSNIWPPHNPKIN
jgi:condensin complex subunit 1